MPHRLRRVAAATVLAVPLMALPVAAPAAVAADYGYGYGSSDGDGYAPGYGSWSNDPGSYGGYSSPTIEATQATDRQSTGVVLIDTVLDYGSGEAAGTGLVLTSDGIVLTNHHVIADSTSVKVTVPSSGRSYVADVVGYDATDDVAVLQLEGASGLATVSKDTDPATTGEAVTAVGNAEGGGTLLAADGTVTATGSDITVSDDAGGSENLQNLIQVNADIVSGDSGGALLDADGDVVGMNVAASTGSADVTGYAIPIGTVLDIATSILAGDTGGDLALGYDAALGVQVYSGSGAAVVAGVVVDGAAANAGITTGSAVTSIAGTSVSTAEQLTTAIEKYDAGERVRVGWTDADGQARSATVTLGRAPIA